MGKMTFVVDCPDGHEPAVSAATDIFGGKLLSLAFKDTSEDYVWRSVAEVQPPEGEYVFVHDGDYASVGWCIAGEWRNPKGCEYLYPITHWMPIPEIE